MLPIALDAMGGDKAPAIVVEGARYVHKTHPHVRFLFVGDEQQLLPLLEKNKLPSHLYDIIHTPDRIAMDEKPSVAVRKGRTSSMRLAIEAVRDGKASATVSAGNTGALMAMSKLVLKSLPGIYRPAIVAVMPAIRRKIVLLDLGANLQCSHHELIQFAYMGDAFAKAVLGMSNPKIGLLNVGSEEEKGHDEVKLAAKFLKQPECPLNFGGYVEGHDMVEGSVDVVVTDGFTGNIALKTAEGTGKMIRQIIKETIESSFLAKIGFMLAQPAFAALKRKIDPRSYNGAMFIGLNGIAVKSHGGSDGKGFANAIRVALTLVEQDINNKIIEELKGTDMTSLGIAPLSQPTYEPVFLSDAPESLN